VEDQRDGETSVNLRLSLLGFRGCAYAMEQHNPELDERPPELLTKQREQTDDVETYVAHESCPCGQDSASIKHHRISIGYVARAASERNNQ
jgi:hypothetical protein